MRTVAIVVAVLWSLAAACAQDAPMLQLNTGGHQGMITNLEFTPDGKFIVSAGEDKVIRVWDWRAGKTVRTMRGHSGPGQEGKIYAMALSPDGRWLAVGGWFYNNDPIVGQNIRLYDFASGELKALLKGHSDAVVGLAFSPDSTRLISGGGDFSAIIWDVTNKKLLHRLEGHTAPTYAVGFSADGARAVTGSEDTTLRLWRVADGAMVAEMKGHSDKVRSLAVSLKDGRVLSGDWSGDIRQWDGVNGAPLKVLASQGGLVGSLRLSPDGRLVVTTCGYHGCNLTQRIFEVASGEELTAYSKHDSIVLASTFSPDGSLVATGGGDNQEIHVWDANTGETKAVLKGTGAPGWAVGFAADGRRIAWGNTNAKPTGETKAILKAPSDLNWAFGFAADGRRIDWGNTFDYTDQNMRVPLETALRLPAGTEPLSEPELVKTSEGWQRAKASLGDWFLRPRRGSSDNNIRDAGILDVFNGATAQVGIALGSGSGFEHVSYSFTPDGKTIISGSGNGHLTAYGLDGKKIGDFVGHEGDVWAVASSPDGRYLLSGSHDQTIRLWNLATRELIVTIFRGTDGTWTIWTPQGFFTSSPGADALVGWQINHGPEHEAEYVTGAQLRKKLNRPDIVARAIALASAEAAIKEVQGANFTISDLLNQPVPKLTITPIAPGFIARGGTATIEAAIEQTPDPVKALRIQVNGRQVADIAPQAVFAPGRYPYTVPLAKGDNTITVTAVNTLDLETTKSVQITHDGQGALDGRGTLYILAIGVDKYPKLLGNDLKFAGADAKAFAEAMAKSARHLHQKVVPRVLVNEADPANAPTAANILDALQTLSEAKETDTVMLFVAGHGVNEGRNYRFIPTDAAWTADDKIKASTVVPWHAFQEAIEGAKGTRLMFLDTCHSGNAYNAQLLNDSVHANILVYTATRADQLANENASLGGGHGFFTFALVEGVQGRAKTTEGEVRAEGLKGYVQERVKALVAQYNKPPQEPQYYKGRDAENSLVALAH